MLRLSVQYAQQARKTIQKNPWALEFGLAKRFLGCCGLRREIIESSRIIVIVFLFDLLRCPHIPSVNPQTETLRGLNSRDTQIIPLSPLPHSTHTPLTEPFLPKPTLTPPPLKIFQNKPEKKSPSFVFCSAPLNVQE